MIDPRNAATFGNSSVDNMLIMFNHAEFLTDEQYKDEVAKRKEFLALTQEETHRLPGVLPCGAQAGKEQTSPTPATPARPSTGGAR